MVKISRKERRAVSPVIAAVILIAVTVAVAVAAGAYIFGIFGGAASNPIVSVISANATGTTLSLYFRNTGHAGDTVDSVTVPGTTATLAGGYTTTVPANTDSKKINYTLGRTLRAGETVSFSVKLASGLTVPMSVTAI